MTRWCVSASCTIETMRKRMVCFPDFLRCASALHRTFGSEPWCPVCGLIGPRRAKNQLPILRTCDLERNLRAGMSRWESTARLQTDMTIHVSVVRAEVSSCPTTT